MNVVLLVNEASRSGTDAADLEAAPRRGRRRQRRPGGRRRGALGVPLAVVATGTANDFARRMGLSDDLGTACRLAVRGTRLRRLDLARIDGRPFVNVASAGLAPAAARPFQLVVG